MKPIFFDLDGTLTDPKVGITKSIQHALKSLNQTVLTSDELTWCIGPPLLASLSELVGDDMAPRALDLYRERFADCGLYENEVYSGVHAMLEKFQLAGHPLYVASSKPQVFVEKILQHFSLRNYFSDVFGSCLDGTRSDKIELLGYALSSAGAAPTESVMVGDRQYDAVGAFANDMQFIGVLYGYGSEEELRAAGATTLARSPADIDSHVH